MALVGGRLIVEHVDICEVEGDGEGEQLLVWAAAHSVFAKSVSERDLLTYISAMLGVKEGRLSPRAQKKIEFLGL